MPFVQTFWRNFPNKQLEALRIWLMYLKHTCHENIILVSCSFCLPFIDSYVIFIIQTFINQKKPSLVLDIVILILIRKNFYSFFSKIEKFLSWFIEAFSCFFFVNWTQPLNHFLGNSVLTSLVHSRFDTDTRKCRIWFL